MIRRKYIDLMNQEFDGTNSPGQSRELENYLKGHEEARTYYRELALALNVFEKVAMLNPPPGLVDGILTRLDDQASDSGEEHPTRGRGGLLAACRDLFRVRLQPAYAYTFIGGLVFGLILFAGSDRLTSSHGPELSGYVKGSANHRSWDLEPGPEASEITLDYPGLSGRYSILRDGPDLRLHLELSSAQPAVIKFRHGPHTALQHYSSDNPTPLALTASSSVVELNHEGDGNYDLVFRQDMDNESPFTFLVYSEGRLIHSQTLNEQGK